MALPVVPIVVTAAVFFVAGNATGFVFSDGVKSLGKLALIGVAGAAVFIIGRRQGIF